MSNIVNNNFNYNIFLKNIKLNKIYTSQLQNQIFELNNNLNQIIIKKSVLNVAYIIYIIQNRTDLVMHIANSQGELVYSINAFAVGFSGKSKQRAQTSIIKNFLQVLIYSNQLTFLKSTSIALHLTNIGFIKQWVIKKLKKVFFIESIRVFNVIPFNGCRKKKLRRKKLKRKKS